MAEPAALDASLTLAGGTSTSLDGGAMTKGSLSGGVTLSETQLGNMALRAKKERKRAEDDRELLRVRLRSLAEARTTPSSPWSIPDLFFCALVFLARRTASTVC